MKTHFITKVLGLSVLLLGLATSPSVFAYHGGAYVNHHGGANVNHHGYYNGHRHGGYYHGYRNAYYGGWGWAPSVVVGVPYNGYYGAVCETSRVCDNYGCQYVRYCD